ncbi:MAG: recombination protein RecR [Gammaproteobacteria bacterium]|nr:recombination protein RecR [Gammaproteobacteria bacterium]
MSEAPLLDQLIQALRCLPGVGPKTAQRMAFHLLERDRDGGRRLSETLLAAIQRVGHCEQCRNFSETPLCTLCASPRRDRSLLCVVESPADVSAIEQSADYRGLYFVLMGRMSPLDGIRPEDIGIDRLADRLDRGEVQEVILATGTTVEGEATAHYIAQIAHRRNLRATRIAHGVPLGGELGYVDGGTLSHALAARREL